jgi:hypothetical protein
VVVLIFYGETFGAGGYVQFVVGTDKNKIGRIFDKA